MTIELNESNFDSTLNDKEKLVIVDFWAPWCAPCKSMNPMLKELAVEHSKKVIIGKLNVDDHPKLASKYGVINIPTLIFFKDGHMVDRQMGGVPKSFLQTKIDSHLN